MHHPQISYRIFLPVIFLLLPFITRSQVITTIAGNGNHAYTGDGGPAINAQLGDAYGVVCDNTDNKYVTDIFHNVIRKITPAGIITTIVGNGTMGYSGDGGPATSAQLNHPRGVAVDNAGNIYFIDQNNSIVRKVSVTGIITTIAGNNIQLGCSGDGGPAANALFGSLIGIAIDNTGNIYLSDVGCAVVRKIDNAGIISRFAGTGTNGFSGDGGTATNAQLNSPGKVFVTGPGFANGSGFVYIPDIGNNRIRSVSPTGIINTFAGTGVQGNGGNGGQAINAQLNTPYSITGDPSGNIYILENGSYSVRRVSLVGFIDAYAGNGTQGYSGDGGPAPIAQLNAPTDISCNYGSDLYIASYAAIRKVTPCTLPVLHGSVIANQYVCGSGTTGFACMASNFTAFGWQVNDGSGWTTLTSNATYSVNPSFLSINATPALNGYQYRAVVSNSCATVYSQAGTLIVETPGTPAVTLSAVSSPTCPGLPVTFTAAPANGGPSPFYQWRINGITVASNSNNTYTYNTLNNGDMIDCIMISNSTCITTPMPAAYSNQLIIAHEAPVTPAISIVASANNVCAGTPITFTATHTNGGPSPSFTWFKNATNLFLNSPAYTDNTLVNGDVIMAVMRTSETCFTSEVVISNPVTMNITPRANPAVTIIASRTSICPDNTPITFTATPVDGGAAPSYQWKKNTLNTGTNSPVYTGNTFNSGDEIICILTSNANCLASPVSTSNPINITVHSAPVVTLDKISSICEGSSRQLNAGNFASYVWNDGTTAPILTISNTGTYYVTVTDNNGCTASDTTRLTTLFTRPSGFLGADTSICSYSSLLLKPKGSFASYRWNTNDGTPSINITQPGIYWLNVNDNNGCEGRDSITVAPKECLKGFYMPTGFTPDNNGRNDIIRPRLFGNVKSYRFSIYNRGGQLIFQTTDPSKGWDGIYKGVKQDTHVFVWVSVYQFEGEQTEYKRGTFVLIR